MKRTIKSAAAVMAAVMAMSCASATAFADSTKANGFVIADMTNDIQGGWNINTSSTAMSKNAKAKAAFEKVTENINGVTYEPIAVLGTQVVSGSNYAVLCRKTPSNPSAASQVVVMYIYVSLDGNAKVTGFKTVIDESDKDGYTVNAGKFAISNRRNRTVYNTYRKAVKDVSGVTYKPVLYMGKRKESGSNYMLLCRTKDVSSDASYQWSIVTVNRSESGNAKLTATKTLTLGETDGNNYSDDSDISAADFGFVDIKM